MQRQIVFCLVAIAIIGCAIAQVTNYKEQNGKRYAVLDNTAPDVSTPGSQSDFASVPNGWLLASPGADTNTVATSFAWGTDCLVLADGTMVATTLGSDCASTLLVREQGGLRPKQRRVLISQQIGAITSVVPSSGPQAGGNLVTITGSQFSSLASSTPDVTEVLLAGVAARIQSQTLTEIVVIAGAATAPGSGDVEIRSTAMGSTVRPKAYTYVGAGAIGSVSPSSGPKAGGIKVTISGAAIGSGSDITSVTLAGFNATIVSQTADQVVVTAPPATDAVSGDVIVTSTSKGRAVSVRGFTYNPVPVIASVSPTVGPASGGNPVTISGQLGNSDIVSVTFNNVAATIVSQSAAQAVVTAPAGTGSVSIAVTSTSFGNAVLNAAYTYNQAVTLASVQPAVVSVAGGSTVTITGNNFGDVTSVTLAGVPATIVSQNATVLVVQAGNSTQGTGDVVVVSTLRGTARLVNAITYGPAGAITLVSPNSAPETGGTNVTISGTALGSGSDITAVTLAGSQTDILSQSATVVVVRTRAAAVNGTGNVVVRSASQSAITAVNAFTFVPPGSVQTVTPASAPADGSVPVTISGLNLGSGSDITAVLLADVPATIISQTDSQVVVTPGASGAVTGSVVIRSASRGSSTLANAFTYTFSPNVAYVVPASGPSVGGTVITIYGRASSSLGSGSDITAVTLNGAAATIQSQNATVVVVRTPASSDQTQNVVATVVVTSTSVGSTTIMNGFTYNKPSQIISVSPMVGSTAGGTIVTVSGVGLGSGSDITAVAFGTFQATIQSQTSDSVVVKTAPGAVGVVDVSVASPTHGVATLVKAFTYNDTAAAMPHITFGGMRYATLDAATPTDVTLTGCQSQFLPLPQGWSVAADNNATRLAVMGGSYKWGTSCLVLASGLGIDSSTLAACGQNMLISIQGQISAAQCPGRVLISAPAPVGEADSWKSVTTLTSYVVYQGLAYATIDNTSPTQVAYGCSGSAFTLPSGWSLAADNVASKAVVSQYNFGTSCLVLGDGYSVGHNGAQCTAGNQLVSFANNYAVNLCDARILVSAPLPVPVPHIGARNLTMRLLIVSPTGDSNDTQLAVAQRAGDMVGTHYDVYAPNKSALAASSVLTGDINAILSSGPTQGNYYGIIVTQWAGMLANTDMYNAIIAYCRAYQVNIVSLYSFPTPAMGVSLVAGGGSGSANTNLRLTSNVASNTPWISGILRNHTLPMTGVFHYPSTITDSSVATPFLEFFSNGTTEGVASVILDPADGHKEMHFFWGQATWSFPSSVYTQMWLNWLTRGVYIGQRRIVLMPQIDDLFLSTQVWSAATNSSTGPAYRISAQELLFHVNFMKSLNAMLPAGSNVRLEFGINCGGIGGNSNSDFANDALYQMVLAHIPDFWWESHTFTHLNLTTNLNGGVEHPTTYVEAYTDQVRNENFALSNIFNTPDKFAYWSNDSMITPAISGLDNGEALRALWDLGIYRVVGDNSIPSLSSPFPYHCWKTTQAVNGFEGMIVLPRWPTTIYYDCSNPEEDVTEYNHYYQSYFGYASTMDQILAIEAQRTASNLMVFRPDPYMFHQANLGTFSYPDPITGKSATHSLLSLWLTVVVQELNQYNTLPVWDFDHHTAVDRCLSREARDNCNVSLMASIDANNTVTQITAVGGGCVIDVTGANVAPQAGVTFETYGPDKTAYLDLSTSGTKSFPLVTPMAWA